MTTSVQLASVQRRGRALRCVISTAEHGAARNGAAVREATGALRSLGPGTGAGPSIVCLADGPTAAPGRVKRLIRDGASAEFGAHLDAEAEQIAASAAGVEGREGVRASTGRRAPRSHDQPAVPAATSSEE